MGEAERQRTIDLLCEAFANDELEVEEFERRVATAHRSTSAEELRRLLVGLPSANVPARVDRKNPAAPHPSSAPAGMPAPYLGEVRDWALTVGLMGGTTKRGHWVPARRNVAVAVMGGCEIDLREASLPPGVTELSAVAFWGGIEIIVPPWIRVQSSGVGIMGGFEHNQDSPFTGPPDAPVLVVSGVAIMGGVEINVRYPGESAKEARRRVKEARRSRRLPRGRKRDDDDDDDDDEDDDD